MTGESGVCTYNWSCKNVAHGVHIGSCMDRFFIGTCCKLPEIGGVGGSQSILSTNTEKVQAGIETNTETAKVQVEPFSENISAKVRPIQEKENIPIPVKSNLNPNHNLHTHRNKLFPSTTTEISSSSLNRKPVLLETSTTISSSDSFDFLNYKHSFSELETANSGTVPTKLLSVTTANNVHSNFSSIPQFDSSTALSSEDQVTTQKLNNSETLQELFYGKNPPNSSEDDSDSFIRNNLTNQWTVSPEADDATLSFILKDNTKDLNQTDTNLHEVTRPGNTFNSYLYSFLTNENKNISNSETNTSTTIELNSSTLPSSDINSFLKPSHLNSQTSQHEINAYNNSSNSAVSEIVSNASATTTDTLTHLVNLVNISNELVNIAKFTEPQYPWPSPSSATENPATYTSQATFSYDAARICGRSRSMMARIVGGQRSHVLKWPWMISLRRFEENKFKHKCGAALLNQFWAITAAHCVDGKRSRDVMLRLGEFNFHRTDDTHPHVERRIYMILIHPDFDPTTYENDIALLRFYEPVRLQANIVPVCLPHPAEEIEGRTGIVTGWGRLSEEGELPGLLHEVHMPIITNKECEDMYSQAGYPENIRDVFVCAGVVNGGLDACEGDSGGPMVVKGNRGQYMLVGLISWGMGCALPKQPGVYTRIPKFVEWIDEIIWH